jgi:hypothetical protein
MSLYLRANSVSDAEFTLGFLKRFLNISLVRKAKWIDYLGAYAVEVCIMGNDHKFVVTSERNYLSVKGSNGNSIHPAVWESLPDGNRLIYIPDVYMPMVRHSIGILMPKDRRLNLGSAFH